MNVFEGGLCLDKGRKAAVLFPKYSEIPEWYTREVENLTEAQLEYGNKSIDWMKWDIRYQVSHVAYVHFFWLIDQWGPKVFEQNDEVPSFDFDTCSKNDRRFDEETHKSMGQLLCKLREGVDLALKVLNRETPEQMREKILVRVVQADAQFPPGDSVLDFWRVADRINPDITYCSGNPNLFRINLVGMFRQMYFECLLHLHTIQRLKEAQGLAPLIEIPKEGYMLLPFFTGKRGA